MPNVVPMVEVQRLQLKTRHVHKKQTEDDFKPFVRDEYDENERQNRQTDVEAEIIAAPQKRQTI